MIGLDLDNESVADPEAAAGLRIVNVSSSLDRLFSID